MRPLRTLALAFALIAAAGLLFSTVGFSAAEIDRSIEIDIVDDESAAIGYEAHALLLAMKQMRNHSLPLRTG